MRKKIAILLVLILVVSSVFVACGKTNEGEGVNNSTGSNELAKDSLIVRLSYEPKSMDGLDYINLEYRDYFGIYECLTTFGENNTRVPQLAEKWDVSEDGMTYTFTLRDSVTFHNGEKLTADDVVYSINRYRKEGTYTYLLDVVKSVEANDSKTVVFQLSAPYLGFLDSMTSIPIVNKKTVEAAGESYARNPIGTGPYKFVSWESGQKIEVESYDGHWGGKVPIAKVTYRLIPDMTTALIALEKGEIDMLIGVPANEYDRVSNLSNVTVDEVESPKQLYFLQNTRLDPKVRHAIAHAIDREGLLQLIEGGKGRLSKSQFEGLLGDTGKDMSYNRDVDLAKKLLSEAGYSDGIDVTLMNNTGDNQKVAQFVQNSLLEAGIRVKINTLETNAMWDLVKKKDFDFYYRIANLSLPDVYDFISPWSTKNSNAVNLQSQEYDQLIEQVEAEPDLEKRKPLYDRIYQIIYDEAIIVPIYYANTNVAYSKGLKNVKADPVDHYDLSKLSW